MTHGLLNLNKPSGMTSRQAVDRVGRLLGTRRVGHAGTLDPLAGGVLVVAVGAATRLIQYVQQMPKSYLGTFLLGRCSPTEDMEGEVTELQDPPRPTPEQVSAAAQALVGRIEQRPPAYSALKIEGRRAYDLARKGRPVELQPREVTIYRLEIVAYQYPQLVLRVECGSGTYIRSLGRDLAESLGTAAVMSALVRTAVGDFRIEEAADPCQLTPESCQARLEPLVRAVEALPKIVLAAEEITRLQNGLTILRDIPSAAAEMAALDAAGRLVSIVGPADHGTLRPLRNFPPG
jgi:tRNA pseudouridine55 synthase